MRALNRLSPCFFLLAAACGGTVVGQGHQLPHFGPLHPGDVPQFVFVPGGEEYEHWTTDDAERPGARWCRPTA
jgi:hypothetical protein